MSVLALTPKAPRGTSIIAYLFLNTQDLPSLSPLSKRVGTQKFGEKIIWFFTLRLQRTPHPIQIIYSLKGNEELNQQAQHIKGIIVGSILAHSS